MTGIWTLMAAGVRGRSDVAEAVEAGSVCQPTLRPPDGVRELPLPLVLEMLSVAIRQGILHSTRADCRGRYRCGRFRCGTAVGRGTVE